MAGPQPVMLSDYLPIFSVRESNRKKCDNPEVELIKLSRSEIIEKSKIDKKYRKMNGAYYHGEYPISQTFEIMPNLRYITDDDEEITFKSESDEVFKFSKETSKFKMFFEGTIIRVCKLNDKIHYSTSTLFDCEKQVWGKSEVFEVYLEPIKAIEDKLFNSEKKHASYNHIFLVVNEHSQIISNMPFKIGKYFIIYAGVSVNFETSDVNYDTEIRSLSFPDISYSITELGNINIDEEIFSEPRIYTAPMISFDTAKLLQKNGYENNLMNNRGDGYIIVNEIGEHYLVENYAIQSARSIRNPTVPDIIYPYIEFLDNTDILDFFEFSKTVKCPTEEQLSALIKKELRFDAISDLSIKEVASSKKKRELALTLFFAYSVSHFRRIEAMKLYFKFEGYKEHIINSLISSDIRDKLTAFKPLKFDPKVFLSKLKSFDRKSISNSLECVKKISIKLLNDIIDQLTV